MVSKHATHHHAQHAHHDDPHVHAFISALLPIAQRVKARYGVPISVLVAQGALESAWGLHVKGNAYFGIKGKSASGESVKFATHEVVAGQSISINDNFRAYASIDEAAEDYGHYLKTNRRYAGCFAHTNDPDAFVISLANAGYATDSLYAAKLKAIIHAHHLAAYDTTGAH